MQQWLEMKSNKRETYTGTTNIEFKTRFNPHELSLKPWDKKKETNKNKTNHHSSTAAAAREYLKLWT